MISRCSLTTLLLINALFVFAQKERTLEGVWKTQDQQDSLIVCVSGQNNPAVFVYFPSKAKFLPFGYSGSDLTHMEPDGSKLVLNVAGDASSLTDAANASGKKVYSKTSSASPVNLKSFAAGADDFFDLSTINYYAGINFYLSTHPGLPFIPNPAFIAKRKLSTIKIEKFFSRVSSDGVQAQKEYDLEYNFNAAGLITTVKVIPYNAAGQDADVWTFNYAGNTLTSVKSPGRVLDFDKDNWEVDAHQQKKVPFIFPMWTYYGNSKPRTATLPYMTGVPLNEYFYNDGTGQLVRICSKDVSEPNILEHCTEYTYDGKGVPVKIVETKRSK
jgi:hypothetical protein